jgi:hypothetical protein
MFLGTDEGMPPAQRRDSRAADQGAKCILARCVAALAQRPPEDVASCDRPEPECPQEAEIDQPQRRQERRQDHDVYPDIDAFEPLSYVGPSERPADEIEQNESRYRIVQPVKDRAIDDERHKKKKTDDGEIDSHDRPLKANSAGRTAVIKFAEASSNVLHDGHIR